MRRLVFALLLLLAVSFVISQLGRLEEFAAVIQRGRPVWIGLAFVVQAAWLLNFAAQYRATYRVLGMSRSVRSMLPLVLASYFLNVAAPTGGASGIALLLDDARRRGHSRARVTIAGVLFIVFEYMSFSVVLVLGLIVLFRRGNLHLSELIASLILFCAAIGLISVVALGMRSAEALERFLVWMARLVNRLTRVILKRDLVSEPYAHEFAAEAAEGLQSLRNQPRGSWLFPIAVALSSKALLISLLFLLFLAFNQPFSVGTLIAGFSMAFLFTIVSPTPMGIGIVEGVMALSLQTLRVPLEAAVIIALAYRGFTLWLPLFYGALILQFSGLRVKASEKV
ncbi:MAG: flippase-like domain-containing protein [Chloroflexi bacterium]|nr:flippase-like domain-containing protein [Chloroflexota bacterium]